MPLIRHNHTNEDMNSEKSKGGPLLQETTHFLSVRPRRNGMRGDIFTVPRSHVREKITNNKQSSFFKRFTLFFQRNMNGNSNSTTFRNGVAVCKKARMLQEK
jgi:hypothetical protein